MKFEWDEQKNKKNRKSHGIWFEEASTVFQDPIAIRALDKKHSELEDRFILIGTSSSSRVLIVVHCYRDEDSVIRIISARKATKKERAVYEEGI